MLLSYHTLGNGNGEKDSLLSHFLLLNKFLNIIKMTTIQKFIFYMIFFANYVILLIKLYSVQ